MDQPAGGLTLPPSSAFQRFAAPLGEVINDYDRFAQVLLLPGLIAARGRLRSLERWYNAAARPFGKGECYYVASELGDARAQRVDGSFCFTVYDAVPYQMLDIFSLAFSAPAFFSAIGDPGVERIERVEARTKPAGYGFFRHEQADPIRPRTDLSYPLCPIREQAALYFTGMALDAIWSHELSHAYLGHLDFVQARLGIAALGERPGPGALAQMPLEAEADRFGTGCIIQAALGRTPYLPIALAGLPVMIRVRAAIVVAAVLTWFWAFQQRIGRELDGEDPYARGTHPPPLSRLRLSLDGARDTLRDLGWGQDRIDAAVYGAMEELEALAKAKSWFAILDPERFLATEHQAFHRDIMTILGDTFRTIQPDLEPLRYTRKAA